MPVRCNRSLIAHDWIGAPEWGYGVVGTPRPFELVLQLKSTGRGAAR